MVRQLVVITGPDKGWTIPLTPGETLRLGRSPTSRPQFTDPHISRVHCELQVEEGRVLIVDSGASGGTFINGQRITQRDLSPGDVIQVGATQLRFQNEEPSRPTPLPDTQELPAVASPPGPGSWRTLTGTTLSHYLLGPLLAEGRSGFVYRARDTKYKCDVAFKVLRPEFANEQDPQRFARTMKVLRQLQHPNLVTLANAGRKGSLCWMAMELVEGESLAQFCQRTGQDGKINWRQALGITVYVARALDLAHRHRLIHKNVDPANILVRRSDQLAKLGDLMLAEAVESHPAQPIARPTLLLGDANYLAPEQIQGGAVDARSDLFALGATVYSVLTGQPPFAGASPEECVTRIRQVVPDRPRQFQPAIPEPFEDMVLKLLAKKPENRFQTAAELLAGLEPLARSHLAKKT